MKIYVNVNAGHDGNGTEQMPFRHINDAAKIAQPGDEVWVAPGVYREYVDPVHAGREDARITYRSVEPLGAVITGAERIQSWVLIRKTYGYAVLRTVFLATIIHIQLWYMETGILLKLTNIQDVYILITEHFMRLEV